MFVQLFIRLSFSSSFAVKWPAHDVNRAIRRAVADVRQTSRSIQVRLIHGTWYLVKVWKHLIRSS